MPSLSFASSGSQYEPQITLITFQPAPRNSPSSSWMILPLPRTGPSSRCRLQLTTKIRLSSFSRAANPIAPSDSGSSISPSPQNTHTRSEEHTSELQSHSDLVCRLLLEKKKKKNKQNKKINE